jgi:hypothetical protein
LAVAEGVEGGRPGVPPPRRLVPVSGQHRGPSSCPASAWDCWRMGRPAPGARGLDGFRDATREERRLWAPPGEVVPIELPAHGGGGRVQRLSPAPALVSGPFQGRQLGPRCRFWSQAAMTVPRLVVRAATMTPNVLIPRPGRCGGSRQAPRDCQRGPLLTDCSQTVRIHLDVPAHVGGKDAGQAHNAGHVCTSWDRLAGFKSRHYWGQGGERLV